MNTSAAGGRYSPSPSTSGGRISKKRSGGSSSRFPSGRRPLMGRSPGPWETGRRCAPSAAPTTGIRSPSSFPATASSGRTGASPAMAADSGAKSGSWRTKESTRKRPEAALTPPAPGEPVPSVPPVEKADGSPLRYGGLRTAFSAAQTLGTFFIAFVLIPENRFMSRNSDTRSIGNLRAKLGLVFRPFRR